MWRILLLPPELFHHVLFLAGYFIGLLFRPKYGITLIVASLLGFFIYAHFFEPDIFLAIPFLFAALWVSMIVAYGVGVFLGVMIRWLWEKRIKIYAVIITVTILIGSFFYMDRDIAPLKKMKADEKRKIELMQRP